MKSFDSRSLEETAAFAREWLNGLTSRVGAAPHEATVVGLSGHLGAGKTAFTKAIAAALGIAEDVTSPTFVIMKIYEIPLAGLSSSLTAPWPWKRLVHIDAYRLERREELDALEWEKLVVDSGNLILIEWPENAGLQPAETEHRLRFEIAGGVHRIEMAS